MYEFSDYLAHHGVLGQKWGKQNGPPYPLSPGQHSASEKKAGWRKSLSGGSSEDKADRWRRKQTSKITTRAANRLARIDNKTEKTRAKLDRDSEAFAETGKMPIGNEGRAKKYNKLIKERSAVIERARREIHVVSNMSLSDIRSERLRVGAKAGAVALSNLANIPLAMLGSPVGLIRVPRVSAIVRNDRQKRYTKENRNSPVNLNDEFEGNGLIRKSAGKTKTIKNETGDDSSRRNTVNKAAEPRSTSKSSSSGHADTTRAKASKDAASTSKSNSSGYTDKQIKAKMERAKSQDKYDMEFLERAGNMYDEIEMDYGGKAAAKRWLNQEYARYLRDPMGYDVDRRAVISKMRK